MPLTLIQQGVGAINKNNMDIKTPLGQSFKFVQDMVNMAEHYWAFHAIDLAIEAFGRSFPEQQGHKQQLIDYRADRYNELFNKHEA